MELKEFKKKVKQIYILLFTFFTALLFAATLLIIVMVNPDILDSGETYEDVSEVMDNEIKDGIHLATGFKNDVGLDVVITNCTNCHSAKLVTQNRATREGWVSIIRWMQGTQNLWDLGDNEPIIVEYLAKNYAPEDIGRRKSLENIEWYDLEN